MFRWFGIRKRLNKHLEPEKPTVYDAAKDNTQLLSIFPQETWVRIAEKLKDNKDTINLSNSATFFRTLLSTQQVQFLFKDVLQLVAHQQLVGEFHFDRRDNIHCYGNRIEARNVILNSRLVCHAWSKAVGDLAGQMESEWTFGLGPKQNNAIHHIFRRYYQISSLDQVNRFLIKFGDSTKNPFFGRTILITLTPYRMTPQDKNIYYPQIALLLQRFGEQVWNCIFHEALCLDDNEQAYSILINLLTLMPNLKHLELINQTVHTCEPRTFPVPPKLENLKSLIFYSIFTPVCNAIVAANPHISRLTAEQPGYNEDVFQLSYPYPFANLEQLELSWWTWKEMRVLGASKTVMWPLKRLRLHFCEHPNIDCEPVTWFELFDILAACFGETLEELEINLPFINGEKEVAQLQTDSTLNILRLPKLKKLNLTVTNPTNFGFLLGTAESLQHLRIQVRSIQDDFKQFWRNRHRQNVQIRGLYTNVMKSNIWSLFPRLKTVHLRVSKLGVRSGSRNDWKLLQQVRYGPGVARTRFNLWRRRILTTLTLS